MFDTLKKKLHISIMNKMICLLTYTKSMIRMSNMTSEELLAKAYSSYLLKDWQYV